jgi:hypothetical protein
MQLLTLEERAKKLFASYNVTPQVRDRYQQDWLRSVQALGDNWLFAKYIGRLSPEQQRARCEDGTYRVTPRATNDSSRA